jgi:hypothetical protein
LLVKYDPNRLKNKTVVENEASILVMSGTKRGWKGFLEQEHPRWINVEASD